MSNLPEVIGFWLGRNAQNKIQNAMRKPHIWFARTNYLAKRKTLVLLREDVADI
jgi:hypothetical protein